MVTGGWRGCAKGSMWGSSATQSWNNYRLDRTPVVMGLNPIQPNRARSAGGGPCAAPSQPCEISGGDRGGGRRPAAITTLASVGTAGFHGSGCGLMSGWDHLDEVDHASACFFSGYHRIDRRPSCLVGQGSDQNTAGLPREGTRQRTAMARGVFGWL